MTAEAQALRDALMKLDEEPLTHLMLGHLELFHSNLLAWFFRRIPNAADRVFGSLTTENLAQTGSKRQVRREKNNLDLWFRWPGRNALVIENKVFSWPSELDVGRSGFNSKQVFFYTLATALEVNRGLLSHDSWSPGGGPASRSEGGGGTLVRIVLRPCDGGAPGLSGASNSRPVRRGRNEGRRGRRPGALWADPVTCASEPSKALLPF
jgi:hypothetical protein